MKSMLRFHRLMALVCVSVAGLQMPLAAAPALDDLVARYTAMMQQEHAALVAKIPNTKDAAQMESLLASDALDAGLVKHSVLVEATPQALAEFAALGKEQEALVEKLLSDPVLMKRMLVADGAKTLKTKQKNAVGPAQYGPAMKIHADIQKASSRANDGVLGELALAIALEHSVPMLQSNPRTQTEAPQTIDPVKRYLSYEKAFLNGELDPAFKDLTAWELRFVVDGEEPDWMHAWGRETLRNYRPDHVLNPNHGWRYVRIVSTNVLYGSTREKFDRPDWQNYQNILANGGICGRRAFFGRFILRSFGIPAIARPSKAHGALAHWTPKGWVINLGPGWGSGRTNTLYGVDRSFLTSSQARKNPQAYLQVKRGQWIGDLMGEKRVYGGDVTKVSGWNGASLRAQQKIIAALKAETLAALGENLGEADEDATQVDKAAPTAPEAEKISIAADGSIVIPAAAFSPVQGAKRPMVPAPSFLGGQQIYLHNFGRMGVNVLRGGGWKSGVEGCDSESRIRSSGLGNYDNWGFRVALSPSGKDTPQELKIDCGNGISLELIYVKPGTFTMGGTNETETKYNCKNVPKHEVTISKGYYLGKYEVTEGQFDAVCGGGPRNGADYPRGFMTIDDAEWFCSLLKEKSGFAVRLPTEAEWEFASRAGKPTRWFFGDDPASHGQFANTSGKIEPVGRKKPNPWGFYDMYGNVWERVADVYDSTYFANSPKEDPIGPQQGSVCDMDYSVQAPKAGRYSVSVKVVTMNPDQTINVYVNDPSTLVTMPLPLTCGKWQDSEPVVVELKQGSNLLHINRTKAPQYGVAFKQITLKPLD